MPDKCTEFNLKAPSSAHHVFSKAANASGTRVVVNLAGHTVSTLGPKGAEAFTAFEELLKRPGTIIVQNGALKLTSEQQLTGHPNSHVELVNLALTWTDKLSGVPGIVVEAGGHLLLKQCSISGGPRDSNCRINVQKDGLLELSHCRMTGDAEDPKSTSCACEVTGTLIASNTTIHGYRQGGVWVEDGIATLTECTIECIDELNGVEALGAATKVTLTRCTIKNVKCSCIFVYEGASVVAEACTLSQANGVAASAEDKGTKLVLRDCVLTDADGILRTSKGAIAIACDCQLSGCHRDCSMVVVQDPGSTLTAHGCTLTSNIPVAHSCTDTLYCPVVEASGWWWETQLLAVGMGASCLLAGCSLLGSSYEEAVRVYGMRGPAATGDGGQLPQTPGQPVAAIKKQDGGEQQQQGNQPVGQANAGAAKRHASKLVARDCLFVSSVCGAASSVSYILVENGSQLEMQQCRVRATGRHSCAIHCDSASRAKLSRCILDPCRAGVTVAGGSRLEVECCELVCGKPVVHLVGGASARLVHSRLVAQGCVVKVEQNSQVSAVRCLLQRQPYLLSAKGLRTAGASLLCCPEDCSTVLVASLLDLPQAAELDDLLRQSSFDYMACESQGGGVIPDRVTDPHSIVQRSLDDYSKAGDEEVYKHFVAAIAGTMFDASPQQSYKLIWGTPNAWEEPVAWSAVISYSQDILQANAAASTHFLGGAAAAGADAIGGVGTAEPAVEAADVSTIATTTDSVHIGADAGSQGGVAAEADAGVEVAEAAAEAVEAAGTSAAAGAVIPRAVPAVHGTTFHNTAGAPASSSDSSNSNGGTNTSSTTSTGTTGFNESGSTADVELSRLHREAPEPSSIPHSSQAMGSRTGPTAATAAGAAAASDAPASTSTIALSPGQAMDAFVCSHGAAAVASANAGAGSANTDAGSADAGAGSGNAGAEVTSSSAGHDTPPDRCCQVCGVSWRALLPGIMYLCAGCERARYCGAACQRKDWRRHRRQCAALRAAVPVSETTTRQAQEAGVAGDP